MGIFGYLSNAHVQQTAVGANAFAQLERISAEISRNEDIISRAESAIESAQQDGVGGDSNIQAQIDREQERIDLVYTRAEPSIQEQQEIIRRIEGRVEDRIREIDDDISRLNSAITNGDIRTAQTIVGIQSDGILGPNTRVAIQEYREQKSSEKRDLEQDLLRVGENPRVQDARREIQRIREQVENSVAESNTLINRLRSQLGTSVAEDIDMVISEQNERIRNSLLEIESLREEQFEIETQQRQLEAEVGPIKYIAEFVYGEADQDILEKAVRWVIVIIIFVFDPLAVLLLIASQYSFRWHGKELFASSFVGLPSDNNSSDIKPTTVLHTEDDTITAEHTEKTIDEPADDENTDLYNDLEDEENDFLEYEVAYPVEYEDEHSENDLEEEPKNQFYTVENVTGDSDQPHELATGYVEYKGKRYVKDSFRHLYPKIKLKSDNDIEETNAGFGTSFPSNPSKGDLFLRVDYLPTRLFKWNSQKWIPVNKESTDNYAYQDAYIDHLIEKISSGEYDADMLTEFERSQIEERLSSEK